MNYHVTTLTFVFKAKSKDMIIQLKLGNFFFCNSIKILFIFPCLFIYFYLFVIYFNTRKKHFNSDSRIYHHSYNLIYHFPSFFVILTFINIKNNTRGFTYQL